MGRRAWGLLLSTFAVFAALVCGPVLIAAGEDAVDGAVIASTNESSALAVEGEGSTKATEDSPSRPARTLRTPGAMKPVSSRLSPAIPMSCSFLVQRFPRARLNGALT